jgi:hypothetical protein
MQWHKITLSSAQVGSGMLEGAQKSFQRKLIEFAADSEMVIFDSTDADLTTTLYISPKMSLVSPAELAHFSATESPAPTGTEPDLRVLVAIDDDDAWCLVRQSSVTLVDRQE